MAKKKMTPQVDFSRTETREYHKGSVLFKNEDGEWEVGCPICRHNNEDSELEYQELVTSARALDSVSVDEDGNPILLISGGDDISAEDSGVLAGLNCGNCGGFFELPKQIDWVLT